MAVQVNPRTLPRFPLIATPTPLQRAGRLESVIGAGPIYVKRDDLTGFAVAGNKARKLELLVADALGSGSDVVVTGGGTGSNHTLATAAAARVAGLDCVVLHYGDPPAEEPPGVRLARAFGAEMRFTGDSRRESIDDGLATLADQLREAGRRPYVIPRGGATPLGAVAYGLALDELAAQLDVDRATIVVATGSGGTQAGLIAGVVNGGRQWQVVGATVSRPVDECLTRVLRLARGAASLGDWPAADPSDVDVRDMRGPGYGIPSAESSAAAQLAAHREGLLLDPVFTAKAMAQVIRLATAGPPIPIVFWHTGGLLAALWAAGKDDAGGAVRVQP
ncbi:MAG TPA: pyridoxal-phosphate dependent enzyme [Jiangellaceae bacterium]